MNELEQLVDDLGRRSFDARLGRRGFPDTFDHELWRHLEETGLAGLTSREGAGAAELAAALAGLARHAAAVPLAETDLLARWLAEQAGLELPDGGPLTVAVGTAVAADGRLAGTAQVPWPEATVLLAARTPGHLHVAVVSEPDVAPGHNLAGEPRGTLTFDLAESDCVTVGSEVGDELTRRGAWARCVQIVGAFDAACEATVEHVGTRTQFGRPLNAFQSVQHSLAAMAGEIERARASVALATAAAVDHGFGSDTTDYAVTVAKVAVGRAVEPVTTIAHQLHGAIGVTVDHRLWLVTMRARSWVDEFGTTAQHAARLGRMAVTAGDPWDVVVG